MRPAVQPELDLVHRLRVSRRKEAWCALLFAAHSAHSARDRLPELVPASERIALPNGWAVRAAFAAAWEAQTQPTWCAKCEVLTPCESVKPESWFALATHSFFPDVKRAVKEGLGGVATHYAAEAIGVDPAFLRMGFDFLQSKSPRGVDPRIKRAAATLGLTWPATPDALDRAWKAKAFATHPDRTGDDAQFKAARDAYNLLKVHT
jgi:hypothetical protein